MSLRQCGVWYIGAVLPRSQVLEVEGRRDEWRQQILPRGGSFKAGGRNDEAPASMNKLTPPAHSTRQVSSEFLSECYM